MTDAAQLDAGEGREFSFAIAVERQADSSAKHNTISPRLCLGSAERW